MSLSKDAVALRKEARVFVKHLNDLISQVFPGRHLKFRIQIGTKSKGQISTGVLVEIRPQKNPARLNAIVLKNPRYKGLDPYVRASFKCRWSTDRKFLAIEKSSFALYVKGDSSNPLVRYEFDIKNQQALPNAHIHIHAHRDEIVWLKSRNTRDKSGKSLLSDIHFPVGGDRFRPCFEDFLAFIIQEFGVKTKAGYRKALNKGRVEWREKQLKAAVRDNPMGAVEELVEMELWGKDIQSIKASKRLNKLEKI